jgi:hypothetical protein
VRTVFPAYGYLGSYIRLPLVYDSFCCAFGSYHALRVNEYNIGNTNPTLIYERAYP